MNKEFKRMVELAGLTEIKINQPNPLSYLLNLQSKIKASEDPKEKLSLAIQCVERVLFMWEEKFPDDNRPRKAIEAAKAYLANPTKENKKAAKAYAKAASAAAYAASTSNAVAAADAASNAADAASNVAFAAADAAIHTYIHTSLAAAYAIKATKKYYKLNEIKVNEPKKFIPLKLPVDPTDGHTKIIVNDNTSSEDFEKEYRNRVETIIKLNPQIKAEFFLKNHEGIPQDMIDTIYSDYPQGVTISEYYKIYFSWLISNLISNFDKYESEEIDERIDKFLDYSDEFVSYATKGRWLVIPDVTI